MGGPTDGLRELTDLVALVARVEQAAERRADSSAPATARLAATVAALKHDHRDAGSRIIADRLTGIADVFGLESRTADLLLVAAAPELDVNFALAYGLLRGGEAPARTSVSLALELCELSSTTGDGIRHLGAASPLREHGLADVTGRAPWLLREVEVADRVVGHLLGSNDLEPALAAALLPSVPVEFPAGRAVAASLRAGAPLVWVRSGPGTSGLSLAAGALSSLGLGRLVVDLHRAASAAGVPELLRAATREAALRGVGLIVVGADRLPETGTVGLSHLETAIVPVVLIGARPWDSAWLALRPFTVDAPVLNQEQRADVWREVGGNDEPPEGLGALRLTPERITQTVAYARLLARAEDVEVSDELLLRAARTVGGSHASGKRSTLGFGDLVLPEHAGAALRRLVSWARHRDDAIARSRMFDADSKGSGIAALFSGSPGTGKTLSAHVVAGELGLDLFQVNLTDIVDKYIGETEKNLEKVFEEAESLNVVLFFDEADALFGRRSDVKDAHDRYANQEVAYLLQRIESYDGITILATNLRGNLDQAFSRRLQFIITFPDPDPPTRRRLWDLYVTRLDFLDPADPPDLDQLAATLEFAGGDIRNVVLAAVYDATAAGESLGMRHLHRAALNEYQKLGRRLTGNNAISRPSS